MERPLHRHASQISFGDTDASGWMHFPNLFHHVEAAEHACLRKRGVLVFDRAQGGWPRVQVSCDFKRPMLAGDSIEVQLRLTHLGTSSLTWEFEVLNARGEVAACGRMTNVRVDAAGKPQPISEEERKALS
ncbi:MAG TPA: thioesterase family protein [Luteolibacter sp.]|nr:thioesterase family protein [Luteolibacter sp.]